jgi:hypothetical protein
LTKQAGELPAVLFLCFCLLAGCAGTQLRGWVYDYEGKAVENAQIEVRAEPAEPDAERKSTMLRNDGSFVLEDLKPYTYYSIIAVCLGDTVKRDRANDVFVQEGKNMLPQNIRLRVVCERESTSTAGDTGTDGPGPNPPPIIEQP